MTNKLRELYSDFLFGESNHRDMAIWAFDYLLINPECSDQAIILLASSTDKDEIIEYTREILKIQGLLDALEPSKTIITRDIYRFFPNYPLPSKITDYHESDPEDYDGEAQNVTDFFP